MWKKLAVFSICVTPVSKPFQYFFIQCSFDFEGIRIWTKFFWFDWQNFFVAVQNFVGAEMFHWKKYNLSLFCALWTKDFHTSDKNCFGSVLDYALYVSRTILWWKFYLEKKVFYFFSDLEWQKFRLLAQFL